MKKHNYCPPQIELLDVRVEGNFCESFTGVSGAAATKNTTLSSDKDWDDWFTDN